MNTETTYWFNNMPKHWQIKRLKDIATLKSGETFTAELLEENGNYPVYGGNGVRGYYSNYTHEGNYVLIGRQGALCGNINYAQGKFFATEHALVVSPFKNEVILWLGETLKAADYNKLSTSAAQPGLSANVLLQQLIPYPPYEERVKIANYLDNKISNIDAYVSERKKERLLLSDLKKAKVAEVVTKGLSPNAQLKDSGIPSIGMIPAHWEVRRIKDIASEIFMGTTPVYEYEAENSNYILGQRNNQLEGITFEEVKFAKDSFFAQRQEYEFLKYGDVLLNTLGGGSVGRAGYYNLDNSKRVITDGHIMVIRSKTYNTKYLYFYLLSIKEQLENMAIGSTNQSFFNISDIRVIPIVVPPIEEQIQIVEYLDHECEQIEKKCALIDEQIQKLQMLKRALINEVVTGKKAI